MSALKQAPVGVKHTRHLTTVVGTRRNSTPLNRLAPPLRLGRLGIPQYHNHTTSITIDDDRSYRSWPWEQQVAAVTTSACRWWQRRRTRRRLTVGAEVLRNHLMRLVSIRTHTITTITITATNSNNSSREISPHLRTAKFRRCKWSSRTSSPPAPRIV